MLKSAQGVHKPSGRALYIIGAAGPDGSPTTALIMGGNIVVHGSGAGLEAAPARARSLDLSGWVLLPAPAEPHAHLDKAFLARRVNNRPGDLAGALEAERAMRPTMTPDDIAERARRALLVAVRHGFTAVRSHVSVGGGTGTTAVEALVSLRDQLRDVVDLQLVAMVAEPVVGRGGRSGRDALSKALDLGAEVVGGAPWLGKEPERAVIELTAAAAAGGHPVDLHADETTDASICTLECYANQVERLGLGGRAVASHCVSLGQLPVRRARSIAATLASTGVGVVVLPQTNLVLQGRGNLTRTPRGLPPIKLLKEAGVLVAAGGDNWRDPFNPLGRADPMETAALLVAAGHVAPAEAYQMVSEKARAIMGLPSAALNPGDRADLLAISASDLTDAVAGASEQRIVFHGGDLASWTEVRLRPVGGLGSRAVGAARTR
jgi:cytosine deaminase